MSRAIKFRAWDKENKQMKVVTELDFMYAKSQRMTWGMQGALNDVWLNSECESYIPLDVILLQFTGLYDKNGKEIYEGDIATEDCNFKGIYLTKIFWDEKDASFSIDMMDGDIDSLSEHNKYIEVIGNIYENPSLLEVQP